jgi:peptide deformylase
LSLAAALEVGVSERLRAIGDRLLKTAREASALGLAAAHIGEVAPVIVVSADGTSHRLMFNPTIDAHSDEEALGEEGSVSLPGVRVQIKRPVWVEVLSADAAGTRTVERFDGLLGRVVQHEIDQMQGVFFLDRLSRLKREMALKKAQKRPSR